jgi:hypothetical protein
LNGWGTKIPVMLQCAGLMHYRGCFDGRCLMEDVGCLMLINDNEWSAECVLQLIESPCRREIGQIDTESDRIAQSAF